MEFGAKSTAGKLEKHFIDPRTGIVNKVGILLLRIQWHKKNREENIIIIRQQQLRV